MNKAEVDKYRERMAAGIAEIKESVVNIKEDVRETKIEIQRQNGRLRETEKDISKMKGIGIAITAVMGTVMGWFGLK